jgi:hypothetical protein
MLDTSNLQKALEDFAEKVVADAKTNLTSRNKVASGKLLNSMKVNNIKVTNKSLELNIQMMPYGAFVDKGVSGVKVKYNTPYSYTNKMPPPSALDGWIVKRGIAPRNDKGHFQTRKGLQFAIARSIFNNGIKPSHFLTDAVDKNYRSLPTLIQSKFGLDIQNTIDFLIKSNFNR